jgi:hypothetical protein
MGAIGGGRGRGDARAAIALCVASEPKGARLQEVHLETDFGVLYEATAKLFAVLLVDPRARSTRCGEKQLVLMACKGQEPKRH